MTAFEKDIIAIIKAALEDTTPQVSDGFDFSAAFEFGKSQQILCLLYYGLARLEAFQKSVVYTQFFTAVCSLIQHSEIQLASLNKLYGAFDAAGIDYLPLKGAVLKSFYPKAEQRLMGDIDLLIRQEQYEKIVPVMEQLGYTASAESDYEYVWKRPGKVCVELHRQLVPPDSLGWEVYYADGWSFAQPSETNAYALRPEDFFIFLFMHFAKHYRARGAGIKFIVDFYVYLKQYPNLDEAYLKIELKKLHLDVFYEHIMELMRVWFYQTEGDAVTDFLTGKIFESGVYGSRQVGDVYRGLKLAKQHRFAKGIKILQMIFPRYKTMCKKYACLEKWPVLLPFLWVWHWMQVLLFRRKSIQNQYDSLKRMSDARMAAYQKELEYVGLDFM